MVLESASFEWNTFIRQYLVGQLLISSEIAKEWFVREFGLVLFVIIRFLSELREQ